MSLIACRARRRVVLLALPLVAALTATAAAQSPRPTLTVFAASDLALAFGEIAPRFEQATGTAVRLVLGSTGNLVVQVEQGAPADVLFAANIAYVDRLRAKRLILPSTQRLYARGRIVLATPKGSGLHVTTLRDLLRKEVRKVAIANPEHAPYGQAARQALEHGRIWDAVRTKLVYAENIRHALQFVQTGAVDAGIVALSMAHVPEVVFTLIDEAWHQPLDQGVAVLKRSPHPDLAGAFVAFVLGAQGRTIMTRYGFVVPE